MIQLQRSERQLLQQVDPLPPKTNTPLRVTSTESNQPLPPPKAAITTSTAAGAATAAAKEMFHS